MDKFKNGFTKFYINILTVLMTIIIIASLLITIGYLIFFKDYNNNLIVTALIFLGVISLELSIIYKNIRITNKILLIVLLGAILRGLWLLNVKSVPVSDFSVLYDCAQDLLAGSTSAFWGSGYIARFPHLTIMVLYMAFMIKVFPVSNLIAIKIFNLLFGVLTIYFIYLLTKEIFNSKKLGLCAASLASIFPPLLSYVGVYCTENIAIPLYVLSTYIFILVVKNKVNKYYLILSGIILSIGNLFRMVATIMVIAFGMYIIIYLKDKALEKVKKVLLFLLPYLLVLVTVSSTLQNIGITEFPLWQGSEPKITSILKGTNINNYGRWNKEDAGIIEKYNYDYDEINEASKEIIVERLTTTNPFKLIGFYILKFSMQWGIGDFEGVFFSKIDVPEENIIMDVSLSIVQLIYTCIMILIFLGLINRRKNNNDLEINLIYLILCGYGVMYLVTESQGRYSLIAAWSLIILSVEGIEFLFKNIIKINNYAKWRGEVL